MPVSKEQVLDTARLCRLDLSAAVSDGESPDARIERIAAEMDAIVGYMDILNQVDTKGVEPLYFPLENPEGPRADTAVRVRSVDEVLSNAPKRQQDFFVVPLVI